MTSFATLSDARSAIGTFLIAEGSQLPPATQAHLLPALAATGSIVPIVMEAIEALYAARAEISVSARQLLRGLIEFAIPWGFYEINVSDRGHRMVQAIRRDLGEAATGGIVWPDPASDPDPDPRYLPVVEGVDTVPIDSTAAVEA